MKKTLFILCSLASVVAFAEGEGAFDPSTLMTDAASSVSGIATAVGTVLVAASGIYLLFLGYRKFKESCSAIEFDGLTFNNEDDLNDYLHDEYWDGSEVVE